MYTTTLNVRGPNQVLDAIAATLASGRTDAGAAAQRSMPPTMAVLIQPMLAPEVAGVAFTADPVTGDQGTVRVSGLEGVGDVIGSGEATSDEWDVTSGVATRRADAGRAALDAAQAQRIAEVAAAIEDAFGSPQDVEWALVDGEVIVLQSRPITALRADRPVRRGSIGVRFGSFAASQTSRSSVRARSSCAR
jgi:pyruvate,water dikinase